MSCPPYAGACSVESSGRNSLPKNRGVTVNIARATFACKSLRAIAVDPAVSQQSRDRAKEKADFIASQWNLTADVLSV
jgi:hypothetical protein